MIREELIGKTLQVVDATNKSLVGLEGEVINETKHTLRIHTMRGQKTLLKSHVTIRVGQKTVAGNTLRVQPEKRTQLKIKKWQRKKPQPKKP